MLQDRPGGWEGAFEEWVGVRAADLLAQMDVEEKVALRGERDVVEVLAEVLARFGVATPADAVFAAVWLRIRPDPGSLDLVRRLRASGAGVHLGTNQTLRRAAYMRAELGYDDLFQVSCYSAELRVAKPDPGFFTVAARMIGSPPEQVLFVDDTEANVEAARSVGMPAVHWHLRDGHALLEKLLAEHGIAPAAA